MPGRVIALMVAKGDRVTRGQPLVVIEAMKMEQTLNAPFNGVVSQMKVLAEAQVVEGSVLMQLEGDP